MAAGSYFCCNNCYFVGNLLGHSKKCPQCLRHYFDIVVDRFPSRVNYRLCWFFFEEIVDYYFDEAGLLQTHRPICHSEKLISYLIKAEEAHFTYNLAYNGRTKDYQKFHRELMDCY